MATREINYTLGTEFAVKDFYAHISDVIQFNVNVFDSCGVPTDTTGFVANVKIYNRKNELLLTASAITSLELILTLSIAYASNYDIYFFLNDTCILQGQIFINPIT